jgi:hypothetical protein
LDSTHNFNFKKYFHSIKKNKILESPKKLIYFIGLVDILTYYGVKKRTESTAKSLKYGHEAENISTVKPEQYARRLTEFVNRNVISALPSSSQPAASNEPTQKA